MKNRHFIILAAALLLCGEGTMIAARTTTPSQASKTSMQEKTKPGIYHRMGTISSVSGPDLVLERKYKGKEESTKFVLNSDTKKEGNLDKGEMATVYYRMHKKERVATEVKVTPPKSKTESKKS